MLRCSRVKILIVAASISCSAFYKSNAQNETHDLGIRLNEAGDTISREGSKLGYKIDWGSAECGPPNYSETTCVWKIGDKFTLTTNRYSSQGIRGRLDYAQHLIITWKRNKTNPSLADENQLRSACRTLLIILKGKSEFARMDEMMARLPRESKFKSKDVVFILGMDGPQISCDAMTTDGS